MTTDDRELPSDPDFSSELCSKLDCDDCSCCGSSSESEKTSAELYSKELDIASSRVQECWQVSVAHIVPLGMFPEYFCEWTLCEKVSNETLLTQVHCLRYAQGYW